MLTSLKLLLFYPAIRDYKKLIFKLIQNNLKYIFQKKFYQQSSKNRAIPYWEPVMLNSAVNAPS